ncbi:PrgI family protein [Candidatus Saccharibacteria bacterium]|nr:PrgI family protein [Candidatus Saccharibacteria bacterium]
MKVTVVPAQVTTVEDRIMGALSFSQLMLLIIPVFFGGGLYLLAPPLLGSDLYKYIVMTTIALICITLAIRVRGKILAFWMVIILRYNLRPKYYLFNKNTSMFREDYAKAVPETETATERTDLKKHAKLPRLELQEMSDLMAKLEHPAAKLRFETTRKGGLYVRLTEIEE